MGLGVRALVQAGLSPGAAQVVEPDGAGAGAEGVSESPEELAGRGVAELAAGDVGVPGVELVVADGAPFVFMHDLEPPLAGHRAADQPQLALLAVGEGSTTAYPHVLIVAAIGEAVVQALVQAGLVSLAA